MYAYSPFISLRCFFNFLRFIIILSFISVGSFKSNGACPTNLADFLDGGTFDGTCAIVTSGNNVTVTVTGAIILTSGNFTFTNTGIDLVIASGGSITIQSGATLDMENDDDLTISTGGTITVNSGGTFDGANTGDNTVNGGTLNISGTFNTYGQTSSGDLVVNNGGSVTVSGSGDVNISDDLKVYGGASFTAESGTTVDVGDNMTNTVNADGTGISGSGTIHIDGALTVTDDIIIQNTTPNSYLIGGGTIDYSGTYTNNDIDDFAGCGTPPCTGSGLLPIDLISFTAHNSSFGIELHWETASETNNDFFTIERSINGKFWDIISQVSGAGNSTKNLDYQTTDLNPISGSSYYRLKQTDYDGGFEYFDAIYVSSSSVNQLKTYPTPAINFLTVELQDIDQSEICLYNLQGKKMTLEMQNETNKIKILRTGLTKGLYLLCIKSDSKNYLQRVVFD